MGTIQLSKCHSCVQMALVQENTLPPKGSCKRGLPSISRASLRRKCNFFPLKLDLLEDFPRRKHLILLKCLELNARKNKLRVNLTKGMGPSMPVAQPAVRTLFFTELLIFTKGEKALNLLQRQQRTDPEAQAEQRGQSTARRSRRWGLLTRTQLGRGWACGACWSSGLPRHSGNNSDSGHSLNINEI